MGSQEPLYSRDFSAEEALVGVGHTVGPADRVVVAGTGTQHVSKQLVPAAGGLLKRTCNVSKWREAWACVNHVLEALGDYCQSLFFSSVPLS